MTVFLPAQTPALDANGNPVPAATWGFTYSRALTPADTDLGDIVTANSAGVFPDITLDVDISYRAILKSSSGQVIADIGAIVDSFFAPSMKRQGDTWRFYTTATTTPQSVYSDESLTIALGASVQANGAGRFPPIYLDEAVSYKAVLVDADGATLATIDPVTFNNMWLYLNPDALIPVNPLEPSADWNGTAGTGFGSPYGAVPTDPTRTTAKPVCRLMVPPNQYFTDTLVVGVWAGANNAGSMLDNLGMEKVVVHFEGATVDLTYPSFYEFTDVNGVARSYLGWWVTLKKPTGTAGHANVYFEAIPADATMQSRVVGPYQFSPVATLHDYSVNVAPSLPVSAGVSYQTIDAALVYLKGVSAQNASVVITEAGNYNLVWLSGAAYAGGAGYTYITATAAVTIKKPTFSTSGTARILETGYDGLWFQGDNITFDFKDANYIDHENAANRQHVFEGVNFIKSDGADVTFMLGVSDTPYLCRDRPWFMECSVSDIHLPFVGASTVRGCSGSGIRNDVFSNVYCTVGNAFHDCTNGAWRTPINALTVQYTGAGTGTIEISAANNVARTITLKVAGSSIGTFVTTVNEAGFLANTNYTVANVVAWINTFANWTATTLDNTRRASALSLLGTTSFGAFGATDCKTAPLTLITAFDLHTDMWRLFTGTQENIVCANNVFYNCVGQGYFVVSNGGTGLKDVILLNNTMDQDDTDPDAVNLFTQLGDIHSHVVFSHNSIAQGINLRSASSSYNPDAYCLVSNNVAPAIVWTGTADVHLTLKDNHLYTGASTPTYATGTTIGGTEATLFTNANGGNFTPIGALLTNLKTPALAKDQAGAVRGATDAAGAVKV